MCGVVRDNSDKLANKAAVRGEQSRKGSRRDIGLAGFFLQVLLATVEMIKGGSGTQLDHFP